MRGISLRWALLPAEVLCCRFGKLDMLFALIAAACSALVVGVWPGSPWDVSAMIGSAFFGACIFSGYRLLLPMALGVAVADILRYRLAFLTIILAGVVAVMASPGFAPPFVSANLATVGMLCGCLGVIFMLMYMKFGSRLLLSAAYLVGGAVCVLHPVGALALFGIAMLPIIFSIRRGMSASRAGWDDMYDRTYFREMQDIYGNIAKIRKSLILCFMATAVGMVGMAIVLAACGKFIPDMDLANMFSNYAFCLKAYHTRGYESLMVVSAVLVFLTFSFSRKATDVQCSFSVQYLLLFMAIAFCAATIPVGLIEKLPPFSGMGCASARTMSLFPDCLAAFALLVSESVAVVELCCREDARERAMLLGYDDIDNEPMTNRRDRQLRAFGVALFSIVVAVAVVIFRLHRLGAL